MDMLRRLTWPAALVLLAVIGVTGGVILAGPALGLSEGVQTGAASLLSALVGFFIRNPVLDRTPTLEVVE